jgi:hypothetical protein
MLWAWAWQPARGLAGRLQHGGGAGPRTDPGARRKAPVADARQIAAYKLLVIDELGYVPLSPTGAELLFDISGNATGAARPL